MKRYLILILTSLLVFSLLGCQNITEESETFINDVRATVIEPLAKYNFAEVTWENASLSVIKDEIDTVVIGKIVDAKEVEITDELKEDTTFHVTKLYIKVTESVIPKSLNKQTIKVSTIMSSRLYDHNLEENAFDVGKEYLFFLYKKTDDDLLKRGQVTDYTISDPITFMIPLDANEEQIQSAFVHFTSELNSNDIVENSKDTATKSFKNFKKFLKDYFTN